MDYHEAAARVTSLQRRRPKLGTETTARMLAHLGDPQASIDVVQIAGSNGKGSTARLLESVLRAAGLSVGLFTSPALNGFREQVRVDGRPIPKRRVVDSVTRLEPCLERLRAIEDEPTHFEALTALAIDHFGREGVDVAVLEVGIGGRYDATSAVDPVASAVTSVSLEHTALLGDTVEEIARDKAQVAPTDAPLVTGAEGDALDAIREETDVVTVGASDAEVVALERGMHSAVESDVSIAGPEWSVETRLSLLGRHQATNAGVAAALARQVAGVEPSTIADGLRGATWPGRFEVVSTEPTVVLDGSHNPGAAATLSDLLGRYDYDSLHVVFAAMRDKEYDRMIAALPPVDAAFAASPDVDRAERPDALAEALDARAERVRPVESVPEATERALATAGESDLVLVTGSLYAVAEARDRWTRTLVPRDGGRRRGRDGGVAGSAASTAAASTETVEYRTFSTTLRPAQADRVAALSDAVGGNCRRNERGAPERLVETAFSGTVPQLRELAAALGSEPVGLRHLGERLAAAIEGGPPNPFGVDRTAVIGVLDVAPDGVADGGAYETRDATAERAAEMVAEGADALEVRYEGVNRDSDAGGGRGSDAARERVASAVESVASLGVPVVVDTTRAAVAEAALDAGADVVADASGLADPAMRFTVAAHDAGLVLGCDRPASADAGGSDDAIEDVRRALTERVLLAERVGVDRDRIAVDPRGGTDGRAVPFALVDRLPECRALGRPVTIECGDGDAVEPGNREPISGSPQSLAAAAVAVERGIAAIRTRAVAATAAVVRTVAGSSAESRPSVDADFPDGHRPQSPDRERRP